MTNSTAPVRTHRGRKALIPLATLLVASAIAVGSGATFTSETNNTISTVTSGSLTHTNTKDDQAIFTAADIKPGDKVEGTLTIENTGSLKADFSLTELASVNQFSGESRSPVEAGAAGPVLLEERHLCAELRGLQRSRDPGRSGP